LPDPAASEAACRRLVAIDDEIANYYSLLGWAVAVQGRYDEAREIFERAIDLDPEHGYAVPNLGYTLMAAGNPESAALYLRRNLARIRETGETQNERGAIVDLVTVMAAAGDEERTRAIVDEAERRFFGARRGAQLSLDDHAYLAQIYAAAGRFDEAEAQCGIAGTMEADDAASRFELARCCAVLGRRDCAIENTRLALEMGFDDPYLPMLVPAMNELLGDPDFMVLFAGSGLPQGR